MNKYVNEIIKLAEIAYKNNCVPVGAIVIDKNGKIIGKGYNKKENTNNPLDHAEIIAITNASNKIKNWKLNDCLLFVTMKPCSMCKCVINEVRIRKVYYLLENEKEEYKNYTGINSIEFQQIENENNRKNYLSILRAFFSQKRKKARKIDDNVL